MTSPRITMFSCVNPSETNEARRHIDKNAEMVPGIISSTAVIPMASLQNFNEWFVGGLRSENLDASGYDFLINVEPDASIANPGAWSPDFLEYDYIGAQWPASWKRLRHYAHSNGEKPEDVTVGNSGFCLMSRKFVNELRNSVEELRGYSFSHDGGCDFYLCIAKSRMLKEKGIRFAPPDVASRFSVERNAYHGSFGVHNWVSIDGEIISLKENRYHLFKDLIK